MSNIEKLAKALFKKVHNYRGVVTLFIIKKQYPRFKKSLKGCWELLILKLLGRDRNANKVETVTAPVAPEQNPVQDLEDAILSYWDAGVRMATSYNYALKCVSLRHNKNSVISRYSTKMGDVGYSFNAKENKDMYFAQQPVGGRVWSESASKVVAWLVARTVK